MIGSKYLGVCVRTHTEIDMPQHSCEGQYITLSIGALLSSLKERGSPCGICQARLSTNCWRFSYFNLPSCHRGAGCHSCEQALQSMVIDNNNTSYKDENGRFKNSL